MLVGWYRYRLCGLITSLNIGRPRVQRPRRGGHGTGGSHGRGWRIAEGGAGPGRQRLGTAVTRLDGGALGLGKRGLGRGGNALIVDGDGIPIVAPRGSGRVMLALGR